MTQDNNRPTTQPPSYQDPNAMQPIKTARNYSAKDIFLWLLSIAALIGATLVNQYLPSYWQPASSIWVRLAIIVGLVIFAIICLALTNQGKAFKKLLQDSRIELRRVTWPSKNETVQYTWQVLVVCIIVGAIIWALDMFFNWFVGLFLG